MKPWSSIYDCDDEEEDVDEQVQIDDGIQEGTPEIEDEVQYLDTLEDELEEDDEIIEEDEELFQTGQQTLDDSLLDEDEGLLVEEDLDKMPPTRRILYQGATAPSASLSSRKSPTKPKNDFNIEGLDIEMVTEDDDAYQVVDEEEEVEEEYEEEYQDQYYPQHYRSEEYYEEEEYPQDDSYPDGMTGYYQNVVESDESGDGQQIEMSESNNLVHTGDLPPATAYYPQIPQQSRKMMEIRHPKFIGMNNLQLISRMVEKGKVINPGEAEDDGEDLLYLSAEQEMILAKKGIRTVPGKRNYDSRDGNDVFVTKSQTKILYLGGGVPLEPVLAHPRLNDVIENFRQELAYRKHVYKDKVKFKVNSGASNLLQGSWCMKCVLFLCVLLSI